MRPLIPLTLALGLAALLSGCVHGGIRHYDPSQPYPDVFNTDAFNPPPRPVEPPVQKFHHGPASLNPAPGNEFSVSPGFGTWTRPPPVVQSKDPKPAPVVEPEPAEVIKPAPRPRPTFTPQP